MSELCIFGASSTWGAGDKEKGGWVNRLRLWFDEKERTYVYNLGIPGNTTEDVLKRFDVETEARKPDIIIFSIGDNDSAYIGIEENPQISLEQYEKNMKELITKAKQHTERIICLGLKKVTEEKTTPIPWKDTIYYTNKRIQKYDNVLQKITKSEKVEYLAVYDLLEDEDLSDGLHPNEQGHEKIFQRVKDALTKNMS